MWGRKITRTGREIAIAGASALAAGLVGIREFGNAGTQLANLSDQTGVAAETLSAMSAAARTVGGDINTMATALEAMQGVLMGAHDLTQANIDTLYQLGLTYQNLEGLGADQQFNIIADAIARVESRERQLILSTQIFGGAGRTLLPVIRNGSAEFARLADEARAAGSVMSNEDARAGRELARSWNGLKTQSISLLTTIGSALMPSFLALFKIVSDVIPAIANWVREYRGLITTGVKVAAGMVALGTAILIVGHVIKLLSGIFLGLRLIVGGVVLAVKVLIAVKILLVPVLLAAKVVAWALTIAYTALAIAEGNVAVGALAILAAFVILAAAVAAVGLGLGLLVGFLLAPEKFAASWKDLGNFFIRIGNDFKTMWGGISDAIKTGDIGLAFEVMWAGVRLIWARAVYGLQNIWLDFVKEIKDVWAKASNWLQVAFTHIGFALTSVFVGIVNTIRRYLWEILFTFNLAANLARGIAPGRAAREAGESATAAIGQLGAAPTNPATARDQRLRELEEELGRELAANTDALDASRRENRDTIAMLTAELADLRQQAARAAELTGTGAARRVGRVLAGADMFGGNIQPMTAAGTFSAAQAGAMAGGQTVAEATLRAAEEHNRLLNDLIRAVGGIGFNYV